ncbi:MAG: Uma2 family endonuclease [Bacteroidota bacterium]
MTKMINDAEIVVKLPDFKWSLERYHAAIDAGVLTENDKIELLFGKLVPMSPIGIAHGKTVKKINRLLNNRLPEEEYTIGVQDPITLVNDSEPEPDLHVASGPLESFDHHPYPEDILLVIEVADSTVQRDRTAKKLSYAISNIAEYWIINVYEKQIERYTEPNPEEGTYGKKEVFRRGDTFASLHLGEFAVDDLTLAN